METEAKFIVPGVAVFERLRKARRIGAYRLGTLTTKTVQDRYVDTPTRHFFQQHFAARVRAGESENGLRFTLKSFGDPPIGAVHRRREVEAAVPGLDITAWPAGEARSLAEEIAGHEALADLVTLRQTRYVATLIDGARLVGEWSLDAVTLEGDSEPFYELEIELYADGRTSDLAELERILTKEYGLRAQNESKFERAMQARYGDAPTIRLPGVPNLAPTPAPIGEGESDADIDVRGGKNGAGSASKGGEAKGSAPSTKGATGSGSGHAPKKEKKAGSAPVARPLPEGRAAATVGETDIPALAPTEGGVTLVATPPPADSKPPAPTAELKPQTSPAPPGKVGPGLLRTDPMPLAGRKVLRQQLARMLDVEKSAHSGDDADGVHDMRVATRRMRAALPVFSGYGGPDLSRSARREVRALAHALGAVRDLDVLIAHAADFATGLPADQQDDLAGLIDHWKAERKRARKALRQTLESAGYRQLKKDLHRFNEEAVDEKPPFDGDTPRPYQVRHVAGSAVWDQYEAVRAYEPIMDRATIPQLHALRITGKRFRYILEFFRDVLPGGAATLIADVTEMQDQLGALHDASVAADLIDEYVHDRHGKDALAEGSAMPPGLAAYQLERRRAAGSIVNEFSLTWANLTSPDWRASLAAAIAGI
jgi:CHAD domain-containing protein